MTAPRFVNVLRAEQHAIGAIDETLRVVRGIAADHADRARLVCESRPILAVIATWTKAPLDVALPD